MQTHRNVFLTLGISLLFVCAGAWAQTATNGDDIIFRHFDDGSGDTSYVIHRYTSVNTVENPSWSFTQPSGVNGVDFLIIGGGGAGAGNQRGGGGGAGGLVEGSTSISTDPHAIVVGGGGAGGGGNGADGNPSTAFDLTALGGGGGGSVNNDGRSGGSGGGSGGRTGVTGGTATQPGSASGGFGNAGGNSVDEGSDSDDGGGGGGGAGTAGAPALTGGDGGDGGEGLQSMIDGELKYYAAGGGGERRHTGTVDGIGGSGIGGDANRGGVGGSGAANTGSGGGAGSTGGDGADGIVVIRYALADVDEWDEHGRYSLSGNARRVLADDAVNLRIAANTTFSILADGELFVGEDADLAVQGTLLLGAGAEATVDNGALTIGAGGTIGGPGIVHGGLTLEEDASFEVVDPENPLTVSSGTVSLGNLAVERLNLDPTALTIGETYTLIGGAATFDYGSMVFGVGTAEDIGDGKSAYFQQGSLQLVVIPEPHTLGLLLAAGALLALRRRGRM